MKLKFGTGVNTEALISNSSQKIRYKYVLKEKIPSFCEKQKFLPKHSLKKVLPWQHPRLLLKMMPYIIILKVRKFHQSTRNSFGTAGKKPVGDTIGGHNVPA